MEEWARPAKIVRQDWHLRCDRLVSVPRPVNQTARMLTTRESNTIFSIFRLSWPFPPGHHLKLPCLLRCVGCLRLRQPWVKIPWSFVKLALTFLDTAPGMNRSKMKCSARNEVNWMGGRWTSILLRIANRNQQPRGFWSSMMMPNSANSCRDFLERTAMPYRQFTAVDRASNWSFPENTIWLCWM